MARRSDHSRQQIREMALSACESLIDKDGLKGLSTRKVAAEIGYSSGTLYQVFTNFDDMIMQLNARTLNRLQLQMMFAQRITAKKRLAEFAFCYIKFAHKQPELWQLLFEHRPNNPDLKPENLSNNIDALFILIRQALTELKPTATNDDIYLSANTLWSSIHGITILMLQNKLFNGEIETAKMSIECLITHFLTGWVPQGEMNA
jgi:AcrR family transcriptional regulator